MCQQCIRMREDWDIFGKAYFVLCLARIKKISDCSKSLPFSSYIEPFLLVLVYSVCPNKKSQPHPDKRKWLIPKYASCICFVYDLKEYRER